MDTKTEILVVDDNIDLTMILQDTLKGEGYDVMVAHDGKTAFAICQENRFNLALIDIKLPDMPGIELINKLAELSPKTEYIIITAHAAMETAIEAVKQKNIVAYQTKPLDMDNLLVLTRQVLKRKQYEEMLKQEKERFQILVEESPVGMSLIDKDGTYKYLNPRFIELLGYTLEDIPIGREWFRKAYPDKKYRKEIISTWMEDLKEHGIGRSRPRKYTVICKDGSEKIINFRAVTLPNQDQLISCGDFTEIELEERKRKDLEAQLAQAQKMEAIGTLAGGIAHDFNNILAAIIGFAELAKMRAPEDSEFLPNMDQILKSGNRAKSLIQQILAFSRKQDLEQKPLQLKYIVKESLKLLRSTLPSDIEIQEDIAKDTGVVNADPTQMQQVIMNLCTNAGHAMQEEGGVLEVGLQNISIGDWGFRPAIPARHREPSGEAGGRNPKSEIDLDPGLYLRLTVSDTGYGITSDVIDRIFEPYYTTKEKGVGTGLGLSVANGIIDSHGGAIMVYSEPGKGSIFHVYLPLIQEEAIKPEIDEQAPVLTGNERILFIDDEPNIVEIGKQMLEHLGYEVTTRTSSLEALELFRNNPDEFDLVITNMIMPKMTGDKLAQELIKIRPDIPVIICTGYSERISEEKARDLGIRKFVMKPLMMRDLANNVRKVLD